MPIIKNDRDLYELIGEGFVSKRTVQATIKSKQILKRLISSDRRGRILTMNVLQYHDTVVTIEHLIFTSHSQKEYRYICKCHDGLPYTFPIQAFKRNSVKFL